MPTNVTTPIWRCDTCRRRYGEKLAAATACESAPRAVPLPPGELLLRHEGNHWSNPGFYLDRLFPLPVDRYQGTTLNEYTLESPGHFAYYLVNYDPTPHIDAEGVVRTPNNAVDCFGQPLNGRQPRKYQGDWLSPHQPGVLQVRRDSTFSRGAVYNGREGVGWLGALVGLTDPGGTVDAQIGTQWVRPLTAEVKAVLDALGVTIHPVSPCNMNGWKWSNGMPLGAVAGERARTAAGEVSRNRARMLLQALPADDFADQVNTRWEAWRRGEPGDVPMPRIIAARENRTYRPVTYSKLTKELKKLVAATGVDWQTRTSAAEYCHRLVEKTLGYTVTTTDRLFPDVPNIIAVAGTKGGVGKSTAAAALARRLAADVGRVVLVDCDLTGPSQHVLFDDLTPIGTNREAGVIVPSPTDLPGLAVISPGQLFGPESQTRWTEQTIHDWIKFVGTCMDLTDVDVVVLDLPPGENAAHDTVYSIALTATLHVTTGHPLALADTRRGLARLDGGRFGRGGHLRTEPHRHLVVENLSRAAGTADSGKHVEIRLAGHASAAVGLATEFGIGFGGSLPWAVDVYALADSQEIGDIVTMLPLGTLQPPATD